MFRARLFTLMLLSSALHLYGDGGRLILRNQAGPITVSVFASPDTLRVGPADLSAMVQKTQDQSAISDADVKIRLSKTTPEGISEVFAPATHAKATNKLLYAANIDVPAPGEWKLVVEVDSKFGRAEVAGEVKVLPPQSRLAAYWPFLAVVPLLAILFFINQWLRRKRDLARPRARA